MRAPAVFRFYLYVKQNVNQRVDPSANQQPVKRHVHRKINRKINKLLRAFLLIPIIGVSVSVLAVDAPGSVPKSPQTPIEKARAAKQAGDANAKSKDAAINEIAVGTGSDGTMKDESKNSIIGFMDPFEYDSRGRRDPFVLQIEEKPLPTGQLHGPFLPIQKFDLNSLALIGIIWDVSHPRAMIMDPEKKVHILGPNAKVGNRNGYIAVIREGEIVVVETQEQEGKLVSTAHVVKISQPLNK